MWRRMWSAMWGLTCRALARRSANLRTMQYAEHDDFTGTVVEFMDDDVGEARHGPFIRAGDHTDVTQLGKFAEAIGLSEDALDDVTCRARAAAFDIETDAGNTGERFKREAHLHIFIDAIWS